MLPDADLLALLYESAGDDGAWSPFFGALRGRLGAPAAGITFREPGGVRQVWEGLGAEFDAAYTAHYHRTDPWVQAAVARNAMVPGRVVTGRELVEPEDLRRNACFQELCRPRGLTDLVGVFLEGPGERVVNASVFLDERGPVPLEDAASLLQGLTPHLARVVRLRQRLEAAPLWEQATTDALERLCVAAVVLDGKGRALRWNHAAENLLKGRVQVRAGGGISLGTGTLDARLAAALDARAPWSTVVADPHGQHVALTLVPLRGAVEDGSPAAMLYLLAQAATPRSARALLQQGFGLTPAESRVAELIAQGMGPRDAALKAGISTETARTQLKSVMAKLGIRRQSQLVRLVGGLRPLA